MQAATTEVAPRDRQWRPAPAGVAGTTAWAWRSDVTLELWVDVVEGIPAVIRLAGTLDSATGANLLAVVEELVCDGIRQFEMETAELVLAHRGVELLGDLVGMVESRGGCLQWDGWVAADPGSDGGPVVP
jgi:hypothetical protein